MRSHDRWCLVHATHVDNRELARIASVGATVGLCPITEANLGDGIFPAARFTALTGSYGIGSDSNVMIDAAQELRTLEYSQRLATRGPQRHGPRGRSLDGASALQSALEGGSRALGIKTAGVREQASRRPDRA